MNLCIFTPLFDFDRHSYWSDDDDEEEEDEDEGAGKSEDEENWKVNPNRKDSNGKICRGQFRL